ncbi:hypothetical protein SAMN05421823_10531 [Catalinimonas alkaloidigena]|uniref:NAD dependent epimerase/dehydratase family protein n=1 Tax=Catalinimonas alkaloidigena TaxID=1075417 RepID=A0A1G9IKU4_9BACT|nr:epimerase [Catalinimonas alkaloidigena]SDL25685.1 hypothetical protein SAMN05421823_10531 [Catalinimonas alkaloidigena]
MKAIITGSTGMVGKGVLLECLASPQVEAVLVINRQSIGLTHPKLTEIVHQDFFNLSPIAAQLAGYDACFFCLGVSSAGMSEEAYRKITYDLTLQVAKTLLDLNADMTFCYVSGAGTDSTEQGRTMWARVKGKTENDLLALPFRQAYMFRPGFIEARKGVSSRTPLYNRLYQVIRPLVPLLRKFPKYATSTIILGQAMLHVAQHGYAKQVLESLDINEVGKA